jgi:hypothetical protein
MITIRWNEKLQVEMDVGRDARSRKVRRLEQEVFVLTIGCVGRDGSLRAGEPGEGHEVYESGGSTT